MADFGRDDAAQLRHTLQQASIKCSERCLYQAAKWAAELAESLSTHFEDDTDSDTESDSSMQDADTSSYAARVFSVGASKKEARLEAKEFNKYTLAKSYFDCHEFERCAAVFLPSNHTHVPLSFKATTEPRSTTAPGRTSLQNETASQLLATGKLPRLSQRSLFLALYARYMAGEKRREEETEMILGPFDKGSAVNKELVDLIKYLATYLGSRGEGRSGGGWLEYLYGVVLARGGSEDEARDWLLKSVHEEPCNWSAWLELNSLIGSPEQLSKIRSLLPQHLMSLLFNLYACQEICQTTEDVHRQLTDLEGIFPQSQWLRTQRALLYYHAKDYDEAEDLFSQIIQQEPNRLDSLDQYSNMLYVLGERPKLAFLAQLASATDKFRPETCCIVGNYFSLKSEHEKAIQYFRRALTLDRHFLQAWTLMGHEFIELKNTHAAIESYRRAVDVDRKDYRAWYGLGQAYEILEMHLYALYYYRRAAVLRPFDSKVWHAVGKCYDKVNNPYESIKAYKRALAVSAVYSAATASFGSGAAAEAGEAVMGNGQAVAETLWSIAQIYERLDDQQTTAEYMEMVVAQEDIGATESDAEEGGGGQGIGVTAVTSQARLWLAHHELQRGNLRRATMLAHELCDTGFEVEEAKAIIRESRSRLEVGGTMDGADRGDADEQDSE